MGNAKIELHKNAWERLPHLPQAVELNNVAAYGDGGTVCVRGIIPADIDFSICLSPVDSVVYMGLPGRLCFSEFHKSRGQQRIYEIAARSNLEGQILGLLKSAACSTGHEQRIRDQIVGFVESNRYFELYRATEENPTTSQKGMGETPFRGTPTPGLVVINHAPSSR